MKILIISIFLFILAGLINKSTVKPKIVISKQESAFNIDYRILKLFTVGQDRLLSDTLWVLTLLESDLKQYKNRDLNSWMFLRFLTISSMDPLFLRNYQFGGQYLDIIKDDLKGSEIIYDKGLGLYPDDYTLNFGAGYLQAIELRNYDKAITNYETLIRMKTASPLIYSLINKLKFSSTGDIELTFKLVEETFKNAKEVSLRNKLSSDLYAIKATIDLKCLNLQKSNCDKKDYQGNLYIKKGNTYVAPKIFKEYKLNFKN